MDSVEHFAPLASLWPESFYEFTIHIFHEFLSHRGDLIPTLNFHNQMFSALIPLTLTHVSVKLYRQVALIILLLLPNMKKEQSKKKMFLFIASEA